MALQEKPFQGGHWCISKRPRAETWGDSEIHRGMLGWQQQWDLCHASLQSPEEVARPREKVAVHMTRRVGLRQPPRVSYPPESQTAWKYVDSTEVEGFTKLLELLPENRAGHGVSRQLCTWPDDIPPPVPQYRESSPFLRYETGGSRWRSKSHTGWPCVLLPQWNGDAK